MPLRQLRTYILGTLIDQRLPILIKILPREKGSLFESHLSRGHRGRGGSGRSILLLFLLRSLGRGSRCSLSSSRGGSWSLSDRSSCGSRGSSRGRSRGRLGLGRLGSGSGSFGGRSSVGLGWFSRRSFQSSVLVLDFGHHVHCDIPAAGSSVLAGSATAAAGASGLASVAGLASSLAGSAAGAAGSAAGAGSAVAHDSQ
jgi:hypothetical protein